MVSQFFTAFLKATFNFEYFEKKHKRHHLRICKIIDGKKPAYVNV